MPRPASVYLEMRLSQVLKLILSMPRSKYTVSVPTPQPTVSRSPSKT